MQGHGESERGKRADEWRRGRVTGTSELKQRPKRKEVCIKNN